MGAGREVLGLESDSAFLRCCRFLSLRCLFFSRVTTDLTFLLLHHISSMCFGSYYTVLSSHIYWCYGDFILTILVLFFCLTKAKLRYDMFLSERPSCWVLGEKCSITLKLVFCPFRSNRWQQCFCDGCCHRPLRRSTQAWPWRCRQSSKQSYWPASNRRPHPTSARRSATSQQSSPATLSVHLLLKDILFSSEFFLQADWFFFSVLQLHTCQHLEKEIFKAGEKAYFLHSDNDGLIILIVVSLM